MSFACELARVGQRSTIIRRMNLRPFTKMHGLGNDFVVFDATREPLALTADQVIAIADRRFGVGCDQLLLVEPARSDDTEFYYRIFNANGSEVEHCGNGARCFARFVHDQGLTTSNPVAVGTDSGRITLEILSNGEVTVNMGPPILEPDNIPFVAEQQANEYAVHIGEQALALGAVSMGNPHAVLRVENVDEALVESLGPQIETDERFPNHVNAGFLEVIDTHHGRLRVWERGAGETLACGTGACAAMVSGVLRGWFEHDVQLALRGGSLHLHWEGGNSPVLMTGPASSVFSGTIDLDSLRLQ